MHDRLDQALLAELKALMEDDFAKLVAAYLEDSERELRQASDASKAGDLERVRRSAHSLKGAASNVGAVALATLCSELEELAACGDAAGAAAALERVGEELHEVLAAFRHID